MPESDVKSALLAAARPHVPFDGWSEATFRAAMQDAGVNEALARAVCPRGAVDLVLACHEAADQAMLTRLQETDLAALRFRDRVAAAVRFRLEAAGDREVVRRGVVLFALPHLAPDGARAIWRSSDRIWTALGDTSDDVNWYTKRAILSGVLSATLLYWLGDDSPGQERTWAFLDRRIADVMQFEKVKAQARENSFVNGLMTGPLAFVGRIRAPRPQSQTGMPGRWGGQG